MLDRERLVGWLSARVTSRDAQAWAARSLHEDGTGQGAAALDDDACLAILYAALEQCVDPVVRAGRVEDLVRLAITLGYGEDGLDGFLRGIHRVGLRRLRAYGVLGLPLGATPDEVKSAHRSRVKVAHPDRLRSTDPARVADAQRELVELNRARTLLASPYEDVDLTGADDVWLETWVDDATQDQPTELYAYDDDELIEGRDP